MRKTMKVSKDYLAWIADLKKRYKATQIKAAVAVNSTMIEFYWNLGKDISERYPGKKRGIDFFGKLSRDLLAEIPEATAGLSSANIRYAFRLYALYSYLPQLVEDKTCSRSHRRQVADDRAEIAYRPQIVEDKNLPQVVAQLICVPWGHHRYIIDKCKGNREKALFYVRRTIQNGWSRAVLLNWLSTDLYEREGKAQTNFALTMPSDCRPWRNCRRRLKSAERRVRSAVGVLRGLTQRTQRWLIEADET